MEEPERRRSAVPRRGVQDVRQGRHRNVGRGPGVAPAEDARGWDRTNAGGGDGGAGRRGQRQERRGVHRRAQGRDSCLVRHVQEEEQEELGVRRDVSGFEDVIRGARTSGKGALIRAGFSRRRCNMYR